MGPSDAEIARTLSLGRLPAELVLPATGSLRPSHATIPDGRVLFLARQRSRLAAAVRADSQRAPRGRFMVEDVPPLPRSPTLGRLVVDGRVSLLDRDEAAATVHTFAEASPVPELLDVGRTVDIYAMSIEGVCVQRRGIDRVVGLADFLAAEPDPLHRDEPDLLQDLAEHHVEQIECFIRQVLDAAGVACRTPPRPVRLDRYGFTVHLGPRRGPDDHEWARLEFARVLNSQRDLVHLLHPVLFHHRSHAGPR